MQIPKQPGLAHRSCRGRFKHGEHKHFARKGKHSIPLATFTFPCFKTSGWNSTGSTPRPEPSPDSKIELTHACPDFPNAELCPCTYASASLQAKQEVLDEGVRQFIQTYCIQCHGPDMDKGDRTFHELGQKKNGQWVVNLAILGKPIFFGRSRSVESGRDAAQENGRQATQDR